MAENLGEFYYTINANTKNVDAGIDTTRGKMQELGQSGEQAGAQLSAAFSKIDSVYASLNAQIESGNIPREQAIEIMKGMIAEEQKYIEILKGKIQLTKEEQKAVDSYNNHQKQLNTTIKQTGVTSNSMSQTMRQNWAAITAKVIAAYASIRFIINAFKDVTEAAIESRVAAASMAAALKAQGRNVEVMLPQYRALASQMQDIAGVSDEVALNAEKELVLRGKTYNEIKKAMPLWANMVASGMSTEEALKIVEQVMGGMPTMLERTNGKLREMRESGASVEEIMAELTKDYAGQAEQITEARMGIDQLKERWGDVKEAIGEVNTGPLADMIKFLNQALNGLQMIIRASSGVSFSNLTLDELRAMQTDVEELMNLAAARRNDTMRDSLGRTRGGIEQMADFEGGTLIDSDDLKRLEREYGNLGDYIQKVFGGYTILNTQKFLTDLTSQIVTARAAIENELEMPSINNDENSGDQPDGGQTTQYIDDWEKINLLVEAHEITLEEALDRMSKIVLSEQARRAELLAIANSEKEMTKEQASQLAQINQHLDDYTQIGTQLASNNEQFTDVTTKLKEISQELEKQESLAEALGEAFSGSIGGSIGNIVKSFGQISDASQVMNAGVSGGKVSAEAMSGATASAAMGWIAIADEVSKVAKQIYDIGTGTGDWGEAFETAILDTLSQIPIIGAWIAEIVDNLWKTSTETLEELQAQEVALEAGGQSTIANKQAQIAIMQELLANTTDVTKQYEYQAEILNLQNEIYEEQLRKVQEIVDTFQKFASIYATAAEFHLDTGQYAAGISELTMQFDKLYSEFEYLYNLNQTQGLTTEQWKEYYDVQSQMLDVQQQIEDAKQRQYDDELEILDAEKKYLEMTGEDVTDNINAQIAALEAKLALESDVSEQYNLRTEILGLQNKLTGKQNDLLDEQINKAKELAGFYDLENVGVQRMIETQLRVAGLSGMDLNTALKDIGIAGTSVGDRITNNSSIGTVIYNQTYTVSGGVESLD